VRWKRNGDGRVAPKGRTRYFQMQPSLPLNQATWSGARSVLLAPARPVLTQSKKAHWYTNFMPLAQVACSIAEQGVSVNTQKWRGMLIPHNMKL